LIFWKWWIFIVTCRTIFNLMRREGISNAVERVAMKGLRFG